MKVSPVSGLLSEMIGTIAVTDYGWYEFLHEHPASEVNFWSPSDRRRISVPQFSPFFFKLKAPHRAIAGFGYFAKWSSLPPWLAWECFGHGNGCSTLSELEARLSDIRARIGHSDSDGSGHIGCTLLVQPVFFPRDAWVRQPDDWSDRTVSGKRYDLSIGEGLRVWMECQERAATITANSTQLPQVAGPAMRYGAPQLFQPRLGQGSFRVSVLDAYGRSCAVTREHSLPALEAAHIRSYESDGPHEVSNGLLLRADLHRLFDRGYVTVSPSLHLEVSPRLRQDYSNGRTYYPMHGQRLHVPAVENVQPAPEFLRWHNDNVYRR